MNTPPGHEIFGNYDYEFAAAEKLNPQKGIVRVLGERALSWADVRTKKAGNWLRGMNEKRKAEKAERQDNGSLEVFYATADTQQHQQTKEAQPVAGEPGLYRSHFSGEQPEAPLTSADNDELMRAATDRARRALGRLPVITMHQENTDAALIAKLNKAYAQPAQEPDRSSHTVPEQQDDDRLVGTQGK